MILSMCEIKKNSTIPRKKDKQQKLCLTRIETCCTSEMTSPLCVCSRMNSQNDRIGGCGQFKRRGSSGRSPRHWFVPLKEIIKTLNVASLLPLALAMRLCYTFHGEALLLPPGASEPTGLPNCKLNPSKP